MTKDDLLLGTLQATREWRSSLAAPLADLGRVQLAMRGHLAWIFGTDALTVMSRLTFNELRDNANPADLFGRRTGGLHQRWNLDAVSSVFVGDGLPAVAVVDHGFANADGYFRPFFADGLAVVLGRPVAAGRATPKEALAELLDRPGSSPNREQLRSLVNQFGRVLLNVGRARLSDVLRGEEEAVSS